MQPPRLLLGLQWSWQRFINYVVRYVIMDSILYSSFKLQIKIQCWNVSGHFFTSALCRGHIISALKSYILIDPGCRFNEDVCLHEVYIWLFSNLMLPLCAFKRSQPWFSLSHIIGENCNPLWMYETYFHLSLDFHPMIWCNHPNGEKERFFFKSILNSRHVLNLYEIWI